MNRRQKPLIGITLGDCNGIGPEVTLKCLNDRSLRRLYHPILLGPIAVYEEYAKLLRIPLTFRTAHTPAEARAGAGIAVVPTGPATIRLTPGRQTVASGRAAGESITRAIELCKDREIDAMVTAPVSKEAMIAAGFQFPGQTEFLARRTGSRSVIMMLVSDRLRVGLVTGHIPVDAVSSALSASLLAGKLQALIDSLRRDFAISVPRVAVLGLNPHAGEGGQIGREEIRFLIPLVRKFRRAGHAVDGPFPADGYWGASQADDFDATLALYHDQGLIPFKMKHFHDGVNFTAGLPIIRTSPDHGTAFAIAAKNKADYGSMAAALKLAARLVLTRQRRRDD